MTPFSQISPAAQWPQAIIRIPRSGSESAGQGANPATLARVIAGIKRMQRILKLTSSGETVLCPNLMLAIPDHGKQQGKLWAAMKEAQRLQFILPIDGAENVTDLLPQDWGAGYGNVCTATVLDAGEQVENQQKISRLFAVPAKFRVYFVPPFLSLERHTEWDSQGSWVIADSSSFAAAVPEIADAWVGEIRESCVRRKLPFFHNSAPGERCLSGSDSDSGLPEHPFTGRVGETIDLHRVSLTVDRKPNSKPKQTGNLACEFSPAPEPDSDSAMFQSGSTPDSAKSESRPHSQTQVDSTSASVTSGSVAPSPPADSTPASLEIPDSEKSAVVADGDGADCRIISLGRHLADAGNDMPDVIEAPPVTVAAAIVANLVETRHSTAIRLTETALQRFERLDSIVRAGDRASDDGGNALVEIRRDELWRAAGHKTWNAYCETFIGRPRNSVNRAIRHALTVQEILENNPPTGLNGEPIVPVGEAHSRPLNKLHDTKKRFKAWRMAVKRARGMPTAQIVTDVVGEIMTGGALTQPSPSRTSQRTELESQLQEVVDAAESWDRAREILTQLRALN